MAQLAHEWLGLLALLTYGRRLPTLAICNQRQTLMSRARLSGGGCTDLAPLRDREEVESFTLSSSMKAALIAIAAAVYAFSPLQARAQDAPRLRMHGGDIIANAQGALRGLTIRTSEGDGRVDQWMKDRRVHQWMKDGRVDQRMKDGPVDEWMKKVRPLQDRVAEDGRLRSTASVIGLGIAAYEAGHAHTRASIGLIGTQALRLGLSRRLLSSRHESGLVIEPSFRRRRFTITFHKTLD